MNTPPISYHPSSGVPRRQRRSERGLTLVEVMLSMIIFGFLSAAIFYTTLQIRRWAEANVREAIATSVATGFLEQLAATDFPAMTAHLDDRSRHFGFVSRDGQEISPGQSLVSRQAADWGDALRVPLVEDVNAQGQVVEGPQMDFWFIPIVERSTDTPNEAVEIEMRFRWDNGRSRATGIFPERSLTAIRTRVPN